MVNALIKIDDETNRILNMIKAKYSFKDKSETINYIAKNYANLIEPYLLEKEKIKPSVGLMARNYIRSKRTKPK